MNEALMVRELRGSFVEYVLLTMSEHGGDMTHEELDAVTGEPMATRDALVELHERRLIEEPDSEGGRLSPFGHRVGERIRQSLLTGQRRADIVQRKLLEWLAGRSIQPNAIEEFAVLPEASSSGVAITEAEIHQAADLLEERGFIRTIPIAERRGPRPEITADGRTALMSDVLISEYGRPNATTINNDYSSRVNFRDHANIAGLMSGGQGNTQNVVQVVGAAQSEAIDKEASQLLALLDQLPDDSEELRRALEELRTEAQTRGPNKSTMKELVHKALAAAAGAVGTEAGQQLLAGIAVIAQLLA